MKQYGQWVSLLRNRLGYTQQEFADMLSCDQGTISKIESGDIIYGEMIHHTAWKLGIRANEFLGTKVNQLEDFYYVEQTKQHIRYLVDQRDYQSMGYYVQKSWKDPHFQSKKDQVFLHWNQGIIELHDKHDPAAAKAHMEEALKLTLSFETFLNRVEILNSYAITHSTTGDLEAALYYFEQAEELLVALGPFIRPPIYTRVLYNLTNTYFHLKQFKKAERKACQAVHICKDSKSTYLRGEVTYQYGYSLYQLGLKEEAKRVMEKSVVYLIDSDEDELAKHAVQKLHELES